MVLNVFRRLTYYVLIITIQYWCKVKSRFVDTADTTKLGYIGGWRKIDVMWRQSLLFHARAVRGMGLHLSMKTKWSLEICALPLGNWPDKRGHISFRPVGVTGKLVLLKVCCDDWRVFVLVQRRTCTRVVLLVGRCASKMCHCRTTFAPNFVKICWPIFNIFFTTTIFIKFPINSSLKFRDQTINTSSNSTRLNSTQRALTDAGVEHLTVRMCITTPCKTKFYVFFILWSISSSGQIGREIILDILVHPEPV